MLSWMNVWCDDVVGPVLELRARGQLAVQDQVGRFEVGAVLGQLLDGIAAVAQDALVAVDVGDLALAQRGVVERRIVAHHPEVVRFHFDLAQIERADRVVGDRHFVGLARAVVGDGERVPAHAIGLSAAGLRRRFNWIHCPKPPQTASGQGGLMYTNSRSHENRNPRLRGSFRRQPQSSALPAPESENGAHQIR